tara:strand:+ start:859 stop:1056 length:198 start_codon:yes stop_codon:yes gene_type:complete
MLRWILLIFIFFSLSKSITNGWLVINWSKFIYDIGYTSVGTDYSINLSEFLKKIFMRDDFLKMEN